MDNSSKEYVSFFSHFDLEFSPRNRLIDSFPKQFSFHHCPHNINDYVKNLDKVVFEASSIPIASIVILDASIKNSVATSISYVHLYNKSVIKTIHWATNIIITETELFAIRYRINQAVNTLNIEHIIVITNFIHAVERISDFLSHPYQTHSVAIFKELWDFFKVSVKNHICYESRLKVLSQETTLVLEWHKRTW